MTAAEMQKTASSRPDARPLWWALVISLAVHVLLLWLLLVIGVAKTIFASSQKLLAEMKRAEATARLQAAQPPPTLTFVQVDPSQAVTEPPKDAKYYSAQSTKASNPDATKDTSAPKIDGTQTHVIQTADVPRTKQFPLQPAPPKEESPPDKPAPAEKTEPKPETPPEKPPPPGDLAMVRPPTPPATTPEKPPDAPPEHQRPHTIVEAQQMAGLKIKQDGGVARHNPGVVTLDTKGSPLGEYDARLVAIIQQHWYDLIERHGNAPDHIGRVVVQFHLNDNGSISDAKVLESDVGDLLSYLCQAAIQDPSPFDPWPTDMKRMIDARYREVTFTFYYE